MADKKNVITRERYEELQNELAECKTTIEAQISKRLEEARGQGDLSENSEYDEAKEAQAKNAARIHEIEDILKDAEILEEDDISVTKVSLGSKVTLQNQATKDEAEYTIVGENEVDFFNNKISEDSLVGQAILNKKKGNVVTVTTPQGTVKYKIIKIGK